MPTKLTLDSNETLKKGAKGAKVQQLQEILKALNLDPGTIDGDFGSATLTAVKQFQSQKGLDADGVVGKNTQNALNNALDNLTTTLTPSTAPPTLQTKGFGGITGKLPLPAIPLIKEFEGCYLKAYPDPLSGNLPITIGWGCTKKRDGSNWNLGESITQQEADDLLMIQLENNYLPLMQKIPVWSELNANQQGALLSFGYNLGANFYGSSNFQSITRVLIDKKWDEIEETFLKYRNPGSNVEAGLKRRRQAEAKLFLTDVEQLTRSDIAESPQFSPDPNTQVNTTPQNLIRYPNLDCPDKVILNQRFSLTIELLLDKPDDQSQPVYVVLPIEDTDTEKLPEVEVVLSHSGFDLEGSNTQIMQVERDDDSSVRFVLIPRKLGQQKIKVQFYQNGKPIGKAIRNILVSEQPVTTEVSQPDKSIDIELKTSLTVPPQDLELFIELDDDGCTLSFFLHSVKEEIGYRRTKVGKVTLQGSPLEKMQAVYKKMTQYARTMPTTAEDRVLAEKRIEAEGNDLWEELIPEKLKQEYWKFKPRVKSILINSDEPWIPWEMIKPFRENDEGEREDDLFWCQQFSIARWLSGAGTVGEFHIKTARPIAPKQENLPSLQEEIAFLEQLSSLSPNITSLASFSTPTQVLDSLKNEDLSIMHFACHGLFDSTSPNDSAIKLSDGSLYPSDIRVRFGGKRQRPLIFINACHGGRAEFSFTGLGGWAERVLKAQAGAFIGAMWEVSDKLALQFTKSFYTALLKDNKTIAESFRQAREEIRQAAPYNSTWLAYTLYADPEGRVKN